MNGIEEEYQASRGQRFGRQRPKGRHTFGKEATPLISFQPTLPHSKGERKGEVLDDGIDCVLTAAVSWEEALGMGRLFKISSAWVTLCPERGDSAGGSWQRWEEDQTSLSSFLPFLFQSLSKISTGGIFSDNTLPLNLLTDLWTTNNRQETLTPSTHGLGNHWDPPEQISLRATSRQSSVLGYKLVLRTVHV